MNLSRANSPPAHRGHSHCGSPPRGFDGLSPEAPRAINFGDDGALRPYSLAVAKGGQIMWHFRLDAFIADAERNDVPVVFVSFAD